MPSLTRKIAEGTAVYTIGNFLNNFLGFLTAVFLIRALGKFEYGLLTLTLSTFYLSTIFLDIGSMGLISSEIARFKEKEKQKTKRLITEFSILQVSLSILISIFIFFITPMVENRYGSEVKTLLVFVIIMVLLRAFDNILLVTFRGFTEFKLEQGKNVFTNFLRASLAFSVFYFNLGLISAVMIYPISTFISLAIFYSKFFEIFGKLKNGIEREEKNVLINIFKAHGKYVPLSVPLKRAFAEIPKWIIQAILGVEAVAIFAVALKFVSFLRTLITPLNSVLFPILSEIYEDRAKIHIVFQRAFKYAFWISIILFIPSFIFMFKIFELLFPGYERSVWIAKILLLLLLITPLNIPLAPTMYAFRLQKYILLSQLYVIPAYFIFFSAFTYVFGLYGSAFSQVVAVFLLAMFNYRYLIKYEPGIKIKLSEVFRIDEYDRKTFKKIYSKLRMRI